MGTGSIFEEKALNVIVDDIDMLLEFMTFKTKSRYVYNGGKVKCYNTPQDFMRDLNEFPESTNFFFGAYFFRSKVTGLDLAKVVKGRNKLSPVFIVSTIKKDQFTEALKIGIVDAVFSKGLYLTEPHDNGQLTDDENKSFFEMLRILELTYQETDTSTFYYEKRPICLNEIFDARMRLSIPKTEVQAKNIQDTTFLRVKAKGLQIWIKLLKLIGFANPVTFLQESRSE